MVPLRRVAQVLAGLWVMLVAVTAYKGEFPMVRPPDDRTIEIANVRSTPLVGGEWTIHFNTRGAGLLKIGGPSLEDAEVRFVRLRARVEDRWQDVKVMPLRGMVLAEWAYGHGELLITPVKAGRHQVDLMFGAVASAFNTTLAYRKVMNFGSTSAQAVEDGSVTSWVLTDNGPSGGCGAGGNRKHRGEQVSNGWRTMGIVTNDDFDDTDAPLFSACDYKGVWNGLYASDAKDSAGTSVDVTGGGTERSFYVTAREDGETSYGYALAERTFDIDSFVTRSYPSFTFTDAQLKFDFDFRSCIGGSGSACDYDSAGNSVFLFAYIRPEDVEQADGLWSECFNVNLGLNPGQNWGLPLINPRWSGFVTAGSGCADNTRFCFSGWTCIGGVNDKWAQVWEGQINIPSTQADWTFCTQADDGSRLFIDGQMYNIMDWDTATTGEECGPATSLSAGWHDIRVEFFESGGGQGMQLKWQSAAGGVAKANIPWTSFRSSRWYKIAGAQMGGSSTDSYPSGRDYVAMWDTDATGTFGSNPDVWVNDMTSCEKANNGGAAGACPQTPSPLTSYCTDDGYTANCITAGLTTFLNTIGTTSGQYRLRFYVPIRLNASNPEKFVVRVDDARLVADYSYDEATPTVASPSTSPNPFSPQASAGVKDTSSITSTVTDPAGGKSNAAVKGWRVTAKTINEEPVRRYGGTTGTVSQAWDGLGELTTTGDYTTDANGYVRNWLTVGPYALNTTPGLGTPSIQSDYHGCDDDNSCADYLGGWENMIRPSNGLSSNGLTWALHNDADCDIDLDGKYGNQTDKIAYIFAYVYSGSAQSAHLRLNYDDGIGAILNGVEVYNNVRSGSAAGRNDCVSTPGTTQFTQPVTLEKGWNDLLIKVDEGGGGWGFAARLTDTSGNALSLPVRTSTPPQNATSNAQEGKYRLYVQGYDSVNQKSSASPTTSPDRFCASRSLPNPPGSTESGTHSNTHDDGVNLHTINETLTAGNIDSPLLSQSFDPNTVGSVENNHTYTQSENSTSCSSGDLTPASSRHKPWESCSTCFWPLNACTFDFDYHVTTTVPRANIKKIEYVARYGLDDDNMRLWMWNQDSASWSNPWVVKITNGCSASAGSPSACPNSGDVTTSCNTYTLCDNDAALRSPCSQWVNSSSGDVEIGWTDEDMGGSCGEDSDFFNIDYQFVRITYDGYQGEVSYVLNFTDTSKSNVDLVEFTTDAWSAEAWQIWKWNYTASSWVNTGQAVGVAEQVRTFTVCGNNAECQDFINASGDVQVRYKDPQPRDAANSPLNVDYHAIKITYGGSFVEVKLDRTEPGTNLTAFSPDPYNSRTPTYAGSASDPLAGYSGAEVNSIIETVEVNTSQASCGGGGSWTACTASDGAFDSTSENYSCALSLTADGTWYVGARARDGAGNTDATPACDTVVIDSVAPTVAFNPPPAAGSTQVANFDVSVTDSDAAPSSGISTCRYKIESYNGSSWVQTNPGSGWTNFASCNTTRATTLTVGSSSDCRNQGSPACRMVVEVTDAAGNTTQATHTLAIDWLDYSGTLYQSDRSTVTSTAETVGLAVNGAEVATTSVSGGVGTFSLPSQTAIGNAISIYIKVGGSGAKANLVTVYGGADVSGLSLYKSHLVVRNDNSTTTTTTTLTNALPPTAGDRVYSILANSDGDADSENLLKIGDASSSVHLYVSNATFAPNSGFDTASGNTEACKSVAFGYEAMAVYGDVITAAGSTLSLQTYCIVVRGNWNTTSGTLSGSCLTTDGADLDANPDRFSVDFNPAANKTVRTDGLNPFCRISVTDANDPGTVNIESVSDVAISSNGFLNLYDGKFIVNNASYTVTIPNVDFLSESSTDYGVLSAGTSGGTMTVSEATSWNAYTQIDVDGGSLSITESSNTTLPAGLVLDVSGGTLTLTGAFTSDATINVSGGLLKVNTSSGSASLDLDSGVVTISGGELEINDSRGSGSGLWWTNGATLNQSAGVVDVNLTGTADDLRIAPGFAEGITGGTIEFGGVTWWFCGDNTLSVSADCGVTPGCNCNNTASTFLPAGGTVKFDKSGAQEIRDNSPGSKPPGFYHLEIATGSTANPVDLANTMTLDLDGNLSVTSGKLDVCLGASCATSNATLKIGGNVTISAGAELDYTASTKVLYVAGDWSAPGTFTAGSSDVQFYKTTGNQNLSMASGSTFSKITVGNVTDGKSPTVVLGGNISATSVFDCSQGALNVGGNTLTLNTTSTNTIGTAGGSNCTLEGGAGGTIKLAGALTVNSGGTLKLTGTSGSRTTLTSTDEATPVRYSTSVNGAVNVNYAIIKYSRGAGLSLGSTSTITDLSNVAFASADNTDAAGDACATTASCGHLTINVPNLNARFKGTTFDNSLARPNGYNVRFCDTTSPYTDGFLLLEREAVPPGGYNNSGTGEAFDADDPSSNAHEAYDDCANDGAMAQWVHYLNTDITTAVSGFPVSAVDSGGTYIGTYVGSGGTLYLLNSKSDVIQTVSLGGGSGNIVGAPYWWYDGATDYVFVTTDAGRVYKYQNAATGDPTGSPLSAVAGWPAVLSTAGGTCKVSPVAATTGPVADDKLVYFGGTSDAGASKTACIFGVENEDAYDSDSNSREQIVTLGACTGASANIAGVPAVKGTWNPKWLHIGSNCSSGELFRVKLDPPTAPAAVNCSRDVVAEIQSWMTGSFGKLFFGTMGGASARFYSIQNTENDTACSATAPDAYSDVTGFPYTPADSVSRGAKVNWPSTLDESYFVDVSGTLYCVCQNIGAGCGGVGAACSGFPVTVEAGQALREPLIDNGTIYVPSNSGKIFALESLYDPSCSDTQCDGTAAGALVGGSEGYPFNLGANMASTLALRTVSGTKYIAVGSDSGRISYLPVVP